MLGDLLRAGYDRSLSDLPDSQSSRDLSTSSTSQGQPDPPVATPSSVYATTGCTDIEVTDSTVKLPEGMGFDPGGIGKGLAADLVVDDLRRAGAQGACVSLGGDLRVSGAAPDGGTWTLQIDHPASDQPIALVGLAHGALATSTTIRRRWMVGGKIRHHLIDPVTGEPTISNVVLASVIAPSAWTAEVLAKSVLLRGSEHPFDVVDGVDAEAIIVTDDGRVSASEGFGRFLGDEALPNHVTILRERRAAFPVMNSSPQ